MDPLYARILIGIALLALALIRIPHHVRSFRVRVAKRRLAEWSDLPLTLAKIGLFLPIFWLVPENLTFADYPLHPLALLSGALFFIPALWIMHRSHSDLGVNWSVTLDVKENHRLVTGGIYRRVRHPMYLGLLLFSLGLLLALPNYVAGPSMSISMIVLLAFRLGPEERMMLDEFGEDYEAYRKRSARLFPGFW